MILHELMNDAIVYDESKLAYSIYWAIREGHVQAGDRYKAFQQVELDMQAIETMMKENPLGIMSVRLYSVKIRPGLFHLVLANDEKGARSELYDQVGIIPETIVDITRGMDELLFDEVKAEGQTIRQIKDTALRIPHYIGIYDKTEKSIEQVEHEYYLKFGKKF